MLPCPQCKQFNYHRSHTKSDYDRFRKFVFRQRKYRCHDCGYIGWEKSRSLDKRSTLKAMLVYAVVIVLATIVGLLTRSLLM